MKRIAALLLVGGLLGGLTAYAPATAKKKKPKAKIVAKDVNYYMHRNGCGTPEDVTSLSVLDGPDEGNGCGNRFSGAPNEVLMGAGEAPIASYVWAASDGVPFTLNATKDLTLAITLLSSRGAADNPVALGAGEATLEVLVTGTSGGETKEIGTASTTYEVTPDNDTYTSELTITPDAALNKAVFTSLELTTIVRGAVVNHGYVELEDPASLITIPTLVKKKK